MQNITYGSNSLIMNEQTRKCFEYVITQYDEKSTDQIEKDFNADINQHYKLPALKQILDLWNRYLQYLTQLLNIQIPTNLNTNEVKYYRSIFNNM